MHESDLESANIGPVTLRWAPMGPYQTNGYIVSVEGTDECWVVDAPYEPEPMIAALSRLGPVSRILLTHAHSDHIGGLPGVRSAAGDARVFLHAEEHRWLENPELNLSAFAGVPLSVPGPDGVLEDAETLTLGGTHWEVRHTPGHSPGSVSLICRDAPVAIVGDALFQGSIGRTDFPTSDHDALIKAIKTKLYTLPDDTMVFPGHGPPTSIGQEKRTNPFVRAD